MKDKLKALFESAVLTEDTKTQIMEAFDTAVQVKIAEMDAEYEVKLEESRSEIRKEAEAMVQESVAEIMEEMRDEIVESQTLEVRYAQKFEQFQESYAAKQEEQLELMVAESVAEAIDQIKEEAELAKQLGFVTTMVEAFKGTYERTFGGVDVSVIDRMDAIVAENEQLRREKKVAELTEGMTGDALKTAKVILGDTPLERMDEKMELIGRVLAEGKQENTSNKQINENADEQVDENEVPSGTVVEESADADVKPPVSKPTRLGALQRSIQMAHGKR